MALLDDDQTLLDLIEQRKRLREQDAALEREPESMAGKALVALAAGISGGLNGKGNGGELAQGVMSQRKEQDKASYDRRMKALSSYDDTIKSLTELAKTRSADKRHTESIEAADRRQDKANQAALDKTEKMLSAKGDNTNKQAFNALPVENQEQVKELAKKAATKTSIKNQIDAALVSLNDPTIAYDQKIKTGQTLLKVLNSSEGQDAVGAEESKRLGSFIEFKLGNITQPGSFLGRDLDKFVEQVGITSNNLGDAITRNKGDIDQLYGRPHAQPAALSLPNRVKVSNGSKTYYIPANRLAEAQRDGFQVVQ